MSTDDESPREAEESVGEGVARRCASPASRRRAASAQAEAKPAPHRLVAALKLLADGKRYTEVRATLEATYGISRATAERDLSRAYAEIVSEAEHERPTIAARISARIRRLAIRSEARRDDHTALQAYGALAKLHSLGDAGRPQLAVECNHKITREDIEQLHAQNHYTNAQRLAEADRLQREISEETNSPRSQDAQPDEAQE